MPHSFHKAATPIQMQHYLDIHLIISFQSSQRCLRHVGLKLINLSNAVWDLLSVAIRFTDVPLPQGSHWEPSLEHRTTVVYHRGSIRKGEYLLILDVGTSGHPPAAPSSANRVTSATNAFAASSPQPPKVSRRGGAIISPDILCEREENKHCASDSGRCIVSRMHRASWHATATVVET